MKTLPRIETKKQLCDLIENIGFLPLFKNSIRGFSVMDLTQGANWFDDNPLHDPWRWREEIAAQGKIAYGKLFDNKTGFLSKVWYPAFANYRRDGYDFDSLYEEGMASRKSHMIMKLFEEKRILPSNEIRRLAGFWKNGERGFDGALAKLQMQTYLTVRGFAYKHSRAGEEYGWATGLYSTPEALFGKEYVRSEYCIDPKEAKEKIINQCMSFIDSSLKDEILKLIG